MSNIRLENLEKNDQTKNVLSSLGALTINQKNFQLYASRLIVLKVSNRFMILLSKFISILDTILELNHTGWSLGEIK